MVDECKRGEMKIDDNKSDEKFLAIQRMDKDGTCLLTMQRMQRNWRQIRTKDTWSCLDGGMWEARGDMRAICHENTFISEKVFKLSFKRHSIHEKRESSVSAHHWGRVRRCVLVGEWLHQAENRTNCQALFPRVIQYMKNMNPRCLPSSEDLWGGVCWLVNDCTKQKIEQTFKLSFPESFNTWKT